MTIEQLPSLNAFLNAVSTFFLITGFIAIKQGKQDFHRNMMVCAVISSALFLTSYLIYHYHIGSKPYPLHDWTRPLYFAILIPHVILAALNTPFIIIVLVRALRGQFDKHKRMARILWPSWTFVSITGIIIYGMLYHLAN